MQVKVCQVCMGKTKELQSTLKQKENMKNWADNNWGNFKPGPRDDLESCFSCFSFRTLRNHRRVSFLNGFQRVNFDEILMSKVEE